MTAADPPVKPVDPPAVSLKCVAVGALAPASPRTQLRRSIGVGGCDDNHDASRGRVVGAGLLGQRCTASAATSATTEPTPPPARWVSRDQRLKGAVLY